MTIEHEIGRETGTREIVDAALQRITDAGVFLRNPGEIEKFLFDHPVLQVVLPDVVREAAEQLGHDGQLALEVDTSAGLGNEYLVLLLRRRSYDSTIIELTHGLTARARDLMPSPDRRFIVTTDFARLT